MYYAAYLRNHQCSSSPINNLPIELLSYIFSLSTYPSTATGGEEVEYRPPTITTESVQVPLVLSSVSRLWRQVALGTPHLWSSLCITVELIQDFYCDERDHPYSTISRQLNTSHITSYLTLSRKYPLNILIDARDENWNFEPECVVIFLILVILTLNYYYRFVPDHGEELYTPAFTSKHMNAVFSLLLPHLSRWKSLSILTDCWAPMYTALTVINPFITRFGAPLLESLSLMRCNDLISFSPLFQPPHLKEPKFLNRNNNNSHNPDIEWCPNMIPSLKYLSLRGVHVDWETLGDSLSTGGGCGGLISLELASHSHDVRPSPEQFHKILSSSSGLRNLVLSASGPSIPEDTSDDVDYYCRVPALLPHLRNITIGYRTAMEGRIALGLIDAPNTKGLVLEDATYVGDPDVINAGPLLSYIGTRQFGEAHENHRITASSSELTTTTTSLSHRQSAAPLVVAAEKPVVNSISCTHVNKDVPESRTSAAAFPLLESVTLRGVKTCSQPLRVFLGSLSNLQHLELTRMSMQAIHALLPSAVVAQITTTTTITHDEEEDCYTTTSNNNNCPCPQLRSLCIRSFEQLDSRDVDFIIGSLPVERQMKGGACQLREVDIHVGAATAVGVVPPSRFEESCLNNMKVNIINDVSSDEDDGEDGDGDGDGDWDGDDDYFDYEDRRDSIGLEDPYSPGGAFNDPLFDEYYSLHFQTVR